MIVVSNDDRTAEVSGPEMTINIPVNAATINATIAFMSVLPWDPTGLSLREALDIAIVATYLGNDPLRTAMVHHLSTRHASAEEVEEVMTVFRTALSPNNE